jgi:uncharacterized protein (TIGR02001 family)
MSFSKSKVALALSVLACSSAFAQTKAPEPDFTLSYNVGVVSDYRYRGISQSAKDPALQGGVDYAHKNGFYLGAWGSTISWIKDATASPNTTKGPVEIDIYGGYKGDFGGGLTYDVGLLQYWYTGNDLKKTPGFANANTLEVYGALSYNVFTLKYSHSTTDLFGVPNSKGSTYVDLSATFDLGGGWSVVPHVGHQSVKNYANFSYTDYSIAVNKDLGDGWTLSGTAVSTDFKSRNGFAYTLPGSGTKDLGKTGLVIGLKKSF